MHLRPIIISAATIASAGLSMASAAPAATLFTNTAHTTPVAVGTTASATNATPIVFTSATSALFSCTASTLSLTLDQNTGGTVIGTFTSGTVTGCSPLPLTPLFTQAWKLTISGAPTTIADVTRWPASITGVHFLLGGGTYHGNLETGVTARQTGAGGHTCLDLNDAGQLAGPLSTNMRLDTSYCFEGTASAYSLG
jgi:hypothetical protein